MKRFPIDCPSDCPHFHCLDIGEGFSYDCDLLVNKQMDDVSMELFRGTFLPICPLEEEREKEINE